jgi:hypothetical protein
VIDRQAIRQRWEADGSKRDEHWRGRPLANRAAIVELIAATTTKTGLKVETALDTRVYEKGIKVSDADMKRLAIRGDAFHPE